MRCVRLAFSMAVLGAVAAFAAPHASALPPPSCAPGGSQSVSSAHFKVYYNDDPQQPDYFSQPQAGTILATAERAYSSFVGELGFPAPAVGSSGKTEFYIADLSTWKLGVYFCYGTADLDAKAVVGGAGDYEVASTVFDEVEYGVAPGGAQTWLMNGFAGWAAWHSLDYPSDSIADIGPFDASLDCDSAVDMANCSKIGFENLGESRWPFYEYLVERFGNTFAQDVFTAVQADLGFGLAGLSDAIAAKGSTLSTEYGNYAAKLLTGGWTATPLNAASIPVSGSPIQTGASSGAIPTTSYGVNHLATKFVEIDRGDGDGSHACYEATLSLKVQIPAGVTTQPTFYWAAGGSAPVPLAISGSSATATVPWDTCKWSSKGYLSLPNTSMIDGTSFTVSGTLTVNFGEPATASTPPGQTVQYGGTTDTASLADLPDLSLFGPELLTIDRTDTRLRLIVESSGDGFATFSLGGTSLGTVAVRAGGNDVRLALPQAILRSLRRSASTMTLSMTPIAANGTTTGSAITRKVEITGTAKPTKKIRLTQHPKKKPVKKHHSTK